MRFVWFAAAWSLAAAAACDRGHPREKTPAAPATSSGASSGASNGASPTTSGEAARAAPAAAPSRQACTLAPLPLRRPMPKRLVAIGDLHGDLAGTRSALRAAGAIDGGDRWIGGELVVVQTGDVLDRGDDEQAILDLLAKLSVEAKAAGGDLIMLLGNHELMNAAGDFRYVTPGALHDFDDVPGVDPSRYPQAPEASRKRLSALGPGGPYAKKLAQHDVVTIVGDTVFSHAGVLGAWVTQVDEVNLASRCWLDGQAGGMEEPPPAMTSQESPVWTRGVGLDATNCGDVKAALAALGVKRMVVGHTVQREINAVCDGAVWRIDVGLGKLYGGPIQVLELTPDGPPKVLQGTR